MGVLEHHRSDSNKAFLAPGSVLIAETQLLLFSPLVTWPLIQVLCLKLCLEFWPCCLTSWKACFPLTVPASLNVELAPPRALSRLPGCLCPHICLVCSLIHTQPGGRPWPVVLKSPLRKINGLLRPLSVPDPKIPLLASVPSAPNASHVSLWCWLAAESGGRFDGHSAQVSTLHPVQDALLGWVNANYFNNTLFIWHHQGMRSSQKQTPQTVEIWGVRLYVRNLKGGLLQCPVSFYAILGQRYRSSFNPFCGQLSCSGLFGFGNLHLVSTVISVLGSQQPCDPACYFNGTVYWVPTMCRDLPWGGSYRT